MADDWKAWLELTLLVAVTLLAVGRWIFGRERSDKSHASEIKRLRERAHDFGTHLSRMNIQLTALEERLRALRDRVERLEGRTRNHRQDNR